METKTNPEFCLAVMEIDTKEQKKWAQAITLAGAATD